VSDWLSRLDAVRARLESLAARDLAGLTSPDEATGEQWEAGQVWAHLAEFGNYWLGELDKVLAGAPTFGRVKSDAARIAAIEAGRNLPVAAHIAIVEQSMDALRTRLSSLTDDDWQRSSRHQTLGDMTIDDQLQHFHVGHYEEHADQLESLT
jgi:DinB superfamily